MLASLLTIDIILKHHHLQYQTSILLHSSYVERIHDKTPVKK